MNFISIKSCILLKKFFKELKFMSFFKKSRVKYFSDFIGIQDNIDAIRKKKLSDFTARELKKMDSACREILFEKKFNEIFQKYLNKNIMVEPVKNIRQFEQKQVKKFLNECFQFRQECLKKEIPIPVAKFDYKIYKFITDSRTRFRFDSKISEKLYHFKNGITASVFGYWNFHATTNLGTVNSDNLAPTILKNLAPILYITGSFCILWSHITKPLPKVSKPLGLLGKIALSPIWACEFVIIYVIDKKLNMPLKSSKEIEDNFGLTWDQLPFIRNAIKILTKDWKITKTIEKTKTITIIANNELIKHVFKL